MATTEPLKPELAELPCPFCGGQHVDIVDDGVDVWVQCFDCDAQGPSYNDFPEQREAIAAWNRRAQPAGMVERLREYAQHSPACLLWIAPDGCDCGLTALLDELDAEGSPKC
jgi:Lar family restriction alleviation protein